MDKKICLDTDTCIDFIKGEPKAEKISDLIGTGKLFVASIIVNNCTLATLNKKHFSRIQDLELFNF